MATHSSVLAWRIPGTAEPGGAHYVWPSMGSHRVGHDWSDLAAAAAGVHEWINRGGFQRKYNLSLDRDLVLSRFQSWKLVATLWTVATGLICLWDSPGKNSRVGCHFLLQGIFLTQGLNPNLLRLLHWHTGSLPLPSPGKSQIEVKWY